LVERLNGIEEVRGSNPLGSISLILKDLQRKTGQVTIQGYNKCDTMRSGSKMFAFEIENLQRF
jgi:hypothetical protein